MTSNTSKALPYIAIVMLLVVEAMMIIGVEIPPQMWTLLQVVIPIFSGGGVLNKLFESLKAGKSLTIEDLKAAISANKQ